MEERNVVREVSEIVRRNVKQVISTLLQKGLAYEQVLVNQYLNGEKSQYEFLLPKSRHHAYYTEQLTTQIERQRERKVPQFELFSQKHQQEQQRDNNHSKNLSIITVVGRVDQVSVGAMCELIKELRQNKQPYEPYDNQVYEQQLTINLQDQNISKKVSSILDMINQLKNPTKIQNKTISPEKSHQNTKIDFLRTQLGTQKDGSMGAWGGKRYEGLGMRDEFTNYRKQASKNFYQQTIPR